MTKLEESIMRVAQGLVSPNEGDRNLEAANVVDALFFVGRCIDGALTTHDPQNFANSTVNITQGLYEIASQLRNIDDVSEALDRIADSITDLAHAVRERATE